MKHRQIIIIVVVIVLMIGAGAAIWYFARKPKISAALAAGQTALPSGYVADPATGVVTYNGTVVGRDNGDNTWTSTNGSIIDFNGKFISASPMAPAQVAAFVAGAGTSAPATVTVTPPQQPMTLEQIADWLAVNNYTPPAPTAADQATVAQSLEQNMM
jgi:hypothetical protein